MISIEKEQRIRTLLATGTSIWKTAKLVGVSRGTVEKIRKLPRLRERNCLAKELKKTRKPRRCRECGASVKVWPCLTCHPRSGEYDLKSEEDLLGPEMNSAVIAEVPELLRIVSDVQEFYKMRFVTHSLFRGLASRARACLRRISIKGG